MLSMLHVKKIFAVCAVSVLSKLVSSFKGSHLSNRKSKYSVLIFYFTTLRSTGAATVGTNSIINNAYLISGDEKLPSSTSWLLATLPLEIFNWGVLLLPPISTPMSFVASLSALT